MQNELLIRAAGISKKYGGVIAVGSIDLDVYSGGIYGVAGLNGAGKSTLLAILAGVMRPDTGMVYYRDAPIYPPRHTEGAGTGAISVTGAKAVRRLRVGYVPQDIALFPDLSVYDNLKFWALSAESHVKNSGSVNSGGGGGSSGGGNGSGGGSSGGGGGSSGGGNGSGGGSSGGGGGGGKPAPIKERIAESAEIAGLADKMRVLVRSLSGGMKRRVNIAAALVISPDVLIMDEPTAGLDVKNRRDILNFIGALARKPGSDLSVICTSHQSGELEMISDRLLLLDRGRAVYDGPPGDVFSGKYETYKNIDDILYSIGAGV